MAVAKGLELAVSPGVEDPILDIAPSALSLVFSRVPNVLDLLHEGVLVGLGGLLGLDTLLLEVVVELVGVPALVGRDDV